LAHEKLLACEKLGDTLKSIALNPSKYSKKRSQAALRVLVLTQLDKNITLGEYGHNSSFSQEPHGGFIQRNS